MDASIRDALDLNADDRVLDLNAEDRLQWRPSGASHRSGLENITSERSITRRMFRAVFRFFYVALIGVAATLAWQSYGDQAMDMVRAWDPSLAELLPASTNRPTAPPVTTSAEIQEQLKPIATDLAAVRRTIEQLTIATDLAAVRRTIEQLTANQDQLTRTQQQMAQSMAALQAAEQQLSKKLSSPPPPKPVPPPKTAQSPEQVSSSPSPKPVNVLPPKPLQPPGQ